MGALGPLGEREATAAARNLKTSFDDPQTGPVGQLVPDVAVEGLGPTIQVLKADLGGDLEHSCAAPVLVNDGDGFGLVSHGSSPLPAGFSEFDRALMRICNYATRNELTPDQVMDCFLAGVQASRVIGAGKVAPSTGWQSADVEYHVSEADGGSAAKEGG